MKQNKQKIQEGLHNLDLALREFTDRSLPIHCEMKLKKIITSVIEGKDKPVLPP